ncbi:probable ubiquitin carboxyl-terminal hydrolase MINDY-4 isoform X1 [Lepisosteus oculatus]|uniref:probable ubiquitin carboxyl-terminal hydrolase MINDY-4 isoform X1 n=1 Tax=Lepisosteus oculatus TaxID=7918 RepID=UPI003718C1F9
MTNPVEEVAASLVREYLSRKGLKQTIASMDQELPRTDLSINNRSDLRRILHLESLYKKNKAQETPLKAMLEIIVKHHMEKCGETRSKTNSSSEQDHCAFLFQPIVVPKAKSTIVPAVSMHDISEEEKGGSTAVSDQSKTDVYRACKDALLPSNKWPSPQKSQFDSKKTVKHLISTSLVSESEKDNHIKPSFSEIDNDSFKADLYLEKKNIFSEIQKHRSSRFVRGMMAGPIASSQQECNRKRQPRRPSGSSFILQSKDEDKKENSVLSLKDGTPISTQSSKTASIEDAFTDVLSQRERKQSCDTQEEKRVSKLQTGLRKCNDSLKTDNMELKNKEENELSKDLLYKKISTPSANVEDMPLYAMKLDDINDEEDLRGIISVPVISNAAQLRVNSNPIDINLASDLKGLLFGSSLNCFNEEWKAQSFTFSEIPQLKYGIVQKKGGPCGVLASVQACVLQKLLFEDTSTSSGTKKLQPSKSTRTKCLILAVAEILWRAGEKKRATIAISSGRKHFVPAGRYKADGILETITLNTVTSLEDLKLFLNESIHQFELGPSGCILLTISAILSRSIELVRKDFDVPTNSVIGAHGYCTQELVNLILTGRAVSNVFNDEIELDSGNGNITLLKGIKGRSDIGLLSLFEHYNVCKVGTYMKTPRYPIWVICSESHFSVLFSTRKELMSDWRMERRFDLYYYDSLANQQEEIRLTVDTSQNYAPDVENDLIPPLEHCIRTKWKGAMVDWNETEPIL